MRGAFGHCSHLQYGWGEGVDEGGVVRRWRGAWRVLRCAGVKRRAQKAQRCSVLASAETSASSFLWKRRDVILSWVGGG